MAQSRENSVVAAAQHRYRRTGVTVTDPTDRPLVRLSRILNSAAAVVALIVVASIVGLGLYAYGHQGRVYQGVSVGGIELGGLTRAEAIEKVRTDFASYMNAPLILSTEAGSYAITPNQLGLRVDAESTIDSAMAFGREGSIWSRSQDWMSGLFGGTNLDATIIADSSRTDTGLLALTDEVARPATNASIDFSGESPSIIPDVPGLGYDYGTTRARVIERVAGRGTEPVMVATSVLQAEITSETLAATLPSAQVAVAGGLIFNGLSGQSWALDQNQLKSIVSISADGSTVNVNRDVLEQMVTGIAESLDRDSTDAILFVNGAGQLTIVPGEQAVAVDVKKSVDQIEAAILAGSRAVDLAITQDDPPITTERAQSSLTTIQNLLAAGITIKWDGGEQKLTSADLLAALIIGATPDAAEAFEFRLSHEVLISYVQTFAGSIEVEPLEPVFRLVDGVVTAVDKGQTGNVINYEDSAERIEKAVFAGYGSSNLKVDQIKARYSFGDAESIKLPDVLGESATPYSNSSEARKTNVERAVDLQNGWLIAPGDTYSYVDTIGDVTEDNGFVVGLGIVANPDEPGTVMTAPVVGGGICQVSTTIFQSAYWAGLTITERWAHPYWIASYGTETSGGIKGLDAMVNIAEDGDGTMTLDMKFVNDTGNWIAIEMAADGDYVTSRILGTSPGWQVAVKDGDPVIENKVKPDEEPIRQDSPELAVGDTRQVETAQEGFDATVTRVVKDKDGNVIDEWEISSTYSATSNRILVGTGE